MPFDGFTVEAVELPEPLVPVSDAVRDKMVHCLAAALCGKTPEDIVGFQAAGWPVDVESFLRIPLVEDELHAHIDLLLVALQSPVGVTS